MLQLLTEKKQMALINQDIIYEKILRKNLNIMEPSSKLLHGLEETTRHGENSSVVRDDLTV